MLYIVFNITRFYKNTGDTGACEEGAAAAGAAVRGLIMLLSQLPDDVLYHILSYLDCRSLGRLSQVCRSIYRFVNQDVVWKKIAKSFLNTGITRSGTDM